MAPLPPDSFLHQLERVPRKGSRRWRSDDGERLFEFDDLHGHAEGYTKRGVHVGVFDVITGVKIADPEKGRRIDV